MYVRSLVSADCTSTVTYIDKLGNQLVVLIALKDYTKTYVKH